MHTKQKNKQQADICVITHNVKQNVECVNSEFQKLANSNSTTDWRALDWFNAGYEFAKQQTSLHVD